MSCQKAYAYNAQATLNVVHFGKRYTHVHPGKTLPDRISCKISDMKTSNTAYISNNGRYTIFTAGDTRLQFIAPYSLEHYESVREWDNGYLVVMAKYAHESQAVEEYIDLRPILDNLYMDKDSFLGSISHVKVAQTEVAYA